MSHDYSISKCTRKCAVSGRSLEPGENFFSVVVPRGEEVSRLDIAASEWKGPEPEMIGWWRSKMPDAASKKFRPAPTGVLLDTLSELLDRPGQENLSYLLALLLVRRRVLSEDKHLELDEVNEDHAEAAEGKSNASDSTLARWNLICPADGRQWNVPIADPAAEDTEALLVQLNALLFTEE
ncbi:MAG: hypothetical protein R3C53_03800 [Pirellulaceae bacterium]